MGQGATSTEQFDLISDDPRCESSMGIMEELREFFTASKELGGLLSQSQAARILNVGTGSISSLVLRGRLSTRMIAGVRMVSAAEVLAFHREKQSEARNAGGRGIKSPSLSELVESAKADCDDWF